MNGYHKAKFIFLITAFVSMPYFSFANDNIEELKAQVQSLQKRVEELEAAQPDGSNRPQDGFFQRGYWDPFEEMRRMQEEMDRMFDQPFLPSQRPHSPTAPSMFDHQFGFDGGPDIDLKEENNQYVVTLDTEDLNKDKLDIQINEHSITVEGERSEEHKEENPQGMFHSKSFGKFFKTIPLPMDADTAKVKTNREGDRIVIHIPKK